MELAVQREEAPRALSWTRLPYAILLFVLWLFTQEVAGYLAVSNGFTSYLLACKVTGGALFMMAAAWATRRSTIWPALCWRFKTWDWAIGSILVLVVYLSGFAAAQLLGLPQEQRMANLFVGLTTFESLMLIAAVIIAAPIGEELAFRHFLQGGLTFRESPLWNWVAALLTAIVFASMHSSYAQMTTYATLFALAMVLGWLRFRSKSIVLLVLLHGQAGAIALLLNLLY
ncbi:TPA: CPBP family intramembrane metalloprotease [Pseudomonas aeruginosa]|nr:CPBP family intramembrane metalloprotease [Pseudomonas aeruginosa]